MTAPRLVVLVGWPKAGKTTAAEILADHFGYTIADDGFPLRDFAIRHMGVEPGLVLSQEGKATKVPFLDGERTVRWILGEFGNALEKHFGDDIIPWMASLKLNPEMSYVMPSVRKDQALFWKRLGATVVEIVNPDATSSPHDFDRFNRECIDIRVVNDGLHQGLKPAKARARLHWRLQDALGLGMKRVA